MKGITLTGDNAAKVIAGTKVQSRRLVTAPVMRASWEGKKWADLAPADRYMLFNLESPRCHADCGWYGPDDPYLHVPYRHPSDFKYDVDTWENCGMQRVTCPLAGPHYISERVTVLEVNNASVYLQYTDGEKRAMPLPAGVKRPKPGPYRGRKIPEAWSRGVIDVRCERAERLQDIEAWDVVAEGIDDPEWHRKYANSDGDFIDEDRPIEEFRETWEAIHGPGSWAASPWVWVLEWPGVENK